MESLDVSHIQDSKHEGIQYLGRAVKQPNGMWQCLANVEGRLCKVEVSIVCRQEFQRLSDKKSVRCALPHGHWPATAHSFAKDEP